MRIASAFISAALLLGFMPQATQAGVPDKIDGIDLLENLKKLAEQDSAKFTERALSLLENSSTIEIVSYVEEQLIVNGNGSVEGLAKLCEGKGKGAPRAKATLELALQSKLDQDLEGKLSEIWTEVKDGKLKRVEAAAKADALWSEFKVAPSRVKAAFDRLPLELKDAAKPDNNNLRVLGRIRPVTEQICEFNDFQKTEDGALVSLRRNEKTIVIALKEVNKEALIYEYDSFKILKEKNPDLVEKYKITAGGIGENKFDKLNGNGVNIKPIRKGGIKAIGNINRVPANNNEAPIKNKDE